eukprot:TRINITY_DN8750_c0_g1_i1.p1 TRINITY_DN8750_c0_g1~~TRINITY_DN8750_c0_g1_i1.p1  ORF type:complete len:273 (+),score=59.31 TRINITY_DN8750_c0_g1_i1:154-972(+)
MRTYRVISLFAILILISTAHADVGDRLLRNFFSKEVMPLTMSQAGSIGWYPVTGRCDPRFGIAYAHNGKPDKSNPQYVFYTSAGQIAGFGTKTWDKPPSELIGDYWIDNGDGTWDTYVHFRNTSIMCSGQITSDTLGDQAMLLQKYNVPLNNIEAKAAGWVMGNCIQGMGIHYAYDIHQPGNQTWNANSLFPLMPMYDSVKGDITAILIAIPRVERVYPFGGWEGPFPNFLFCKNWCASSDCHWKHTSWWSTQHWLFGNPDLQKCVGAPCAL